MTVSIDYNTYVIAVSKDETQLVGINPATGLEVRELNIDTFGRTLADVQDNTDDVWASTAFSYTKPANIGGVFLAAVLLILEPYTITFEDGQYAINLIGGNTNIQDVTNVNQVSIRPSNSAGLTFSEEINSQSYINGLIYINVTDGLNGSVYPRGTPKSPVNNFNDAVLINNQEKLNSYYLDDTLIVTPIQDITEYSFRGKNPAKSTMVIQGSDTQFTNFDNLTLTGTLNGRVFVSGSIVGDITDFSGGIVNSILVGTVVLDSTFSDTVNILQSGSGVAGTNTPIIDFNTSDAPLSIRDYSGGVKLVNLTEGNNVSIDLMAGKVILDATSTSGMVIVRGGGRLIDSNTGDDIPSGTYNGGVTIVNETLFNWTVGTKDNALTALTSIIDVMALLRKYEENRYVIDKINNTLTVYDNDNTTPILQFSLLDSTATPSTTEVAERLPI